MRFTQPVMLTGGPICPGFGISFVSTRGVAPAVPAFGAVVGVVAVPGVGSDGFVGVLGDGVVVVGGVGDTGAAGVDGWPGVIAGGAGAGAPGCAGRAGGWAGAGGWAKSSAAPSVKARRVVAAALASSRGEVEEVISS